jgi:Zn-dependent membrane protease YugP
MDQFTGSGLGAGVAGVTGMQWILMIAIGLLGFVVQARLQAVFKKYSKVMFTGGLTGREVAEKMLRDYGIESVKVVPTRGQLTDNYNPRTRTINLSEGVYESNSVSAAAVAAHETGHAVQHARHYGPLKLRNTVAPFVMFTSKWVFIVLMIGIFISNYLLWVGIGMIALATLFSLITLPVEFNASARAVKWLESSGTLSAGELRDAKTALSWAAGTYVVAALGSVVTLLYYISIANRRS